MEHSLAIRYTANTQRVAAQQALIVCLRLSVMSQTLCKYISYTVLKMLTSRKKFHLEKSGVTSLVK